MTPEAQPQSQPRLQVIKPFKKVVDQIARRIPGREPAWLRNPLLTQEAKERLKAIRENAERSWQEELARRAKEPKADFGTYEEWLAYVALRKRLKQEAAARGDAEIDYSQLPWRPQALAKQPEEPLTDEQRSIKNKETVRTLHTRLIKEAKTAQFDLIAEAIQQEIWNDPRKVHPQYAPPSFIHQTGQVNVTIHKDGTVKDRSRSGVTIASMHDKSTGKAVRLFPYENTMANSISFGIGYFGERSQIIPEARQAVSDDELERGAKAYYIERTYLEVEKDGMKKKTELYVIPLAYAESRKEFVEYLYEIANLQSPKEVRLQAKQRMRTSRRGQQAKAA